MPAEQRPPAPGPGAALRLLEQAWVQALLLVLAVSAAYWRIGGHEFVHIDVSEYLLDNPYVQRGFDAEFLGWAWTANYASNWHPLTWMSHALDVQLFGLAPRGHNLENVGWHALNSVWVLLIARRFLGRSPWAFFVAVLFALHPLRVESVAWIAERKEVLAASFGLAALWSWSFWAREGRRAGYAGALGLFALGLCAKPTLVSWPLVLLLFDVWPFARTARGARALLVEKLPFVALSALSCALTLWAQSTGQAVQPLELLPFDLRVANALHAYGVYLWQTIWPLELVSFYAHPGATLAWKPVLLAGLVLAALGTLAWRARRAAPWFAVGLAFFVVTLLPMIGLVQVGGQAHADRYMYLPQLGLLFAIALGAETLVRRIQGLRGLVAGCAALAALALFSLTQAQLAHWHDARALGEHQWKVAGESPWALNLIGRDLLGELRADEAVEVLRRATEVNPYSSKAWHLLGKAYTLQQDYARAEDALRRALRIEPDNPAMLNHLGEVLLAQFRPADAAPYVARALELAPDYAGAHMNQGKLARQRGDFATARRAFQRAVELKPDLLPARMSLAHCQMIDGDFAAAADELARVLAVLPDDLDARRGRGRALQALGRHAEAAAEFEHALQLVPEHALALADLAWVLAAAPSAPPRDLPRAVRLIERAVQLDAGANFSVLDAAGFVYASAGRFPDAIAAATAALERARALPEVQLAARIQERLAGYQAGRVDPATPR